MQKHSYAAGILSLVFIMGCHGERKAVDSSLSDDLEKIQVVSDTRRLAEAATPSLASGVIVEDAPAESALGLAGIQSGDVLLSWSRQSNLSPETGRFDSPFDFHEVRVEQAPRGSIEILGEREGVTESWTVELGSWRGVQVGFRWTGVQLASYRVHQERIKNGEVEEAVKVLQVLEEGTVWGEKGHPKLWMRFKLESLSFNSSDRDPPSASGNSELLQTQSEEMGGLLETAFVHQEIATLLAKRGDLDKAESLNLQALDVRVDVAPGSLKCAESLNGLGRLAWIRGDLDRAKEMHEGALMIRDKEAPRSLEVAESLNNLGLVAWNRGNLDQAIELHTSALSIREDLAPEGLEVANSLNNLGLVAWDRGEIERAYDLYIRTARIDEKLNPEGLGLASTLNNLGILANSRGDLEEAEEIHGRALRIRERKAPDSLLVAESLNNLSAVARHRGELERAYGLLQRAHRIFEALAPESLHLAGSFSNLGRMAREQGDFQLAFGHLQRSLQLCQRLAPEGAATVSTLNSLGDLSRALGDFDQAHDFFSQALILTEILAPKSLRLAAAAAGLGGVALDRGNLKQAKEFLSVALETQEQIAPRSLYVAGTLNSLGILAKQLGDLEESQALHNRALGIRQELAPESLDLANSLDNLAVLATAREDFGLAHWHFTEALRIEEDLAPGSLTVASSLYNFGNLTRKRGDLERAQKIYSRALDIHKQVAPGSLNLALNYNAMADMMLAEGDLGGATLNYLQALDALEHQIANLGGSYNLQATFRSQQRDAYLEALEVLLSQNLQEKASHVLERFRARTFLSMLAEREIVYEREIPANLDRQRRRLNVRYDRILSRLAKLSAYRDQKEVETILAQLDEMSLERGGIEEQIRASSPRLATLQYPRPLTSSEVRRLLDPGTLAVSFLVGQDATSIFSLSREKTLEVKTVSIGEAVLRERSKSLRELLAGAIDDTQLGRERTLAFRAVSLDLYRLLLEPIADRIETSDRILIVPDGPLHSFPFAALVREDRNSNEQYLLEWKPLHLSLSMTTHAELKRNRPATADAQSVSFRVAAFGDPSYPDAFGLPEVEGRDSSLPTDAVLRSVSSREGVNFHWPPLPYSRREVEGIANLFPAGQVQVHLGAEAIEEKIKNLDPDVRILHLAAHAIADDHLPLSSFVALTIPENLPEGRDNGLLQAWEILEQVRVNADLVVLSGCFTGMGKELRGEGMIGLTRAFQYAGARSLISTLWNVDDQAQAELMIRFYRHLRDGLTKDEALRAAQIQMLREPIMSVDQDGNPMLLENASAPFYWAGVQLYGDWQ